MLPASPKYAPWFAVIRIYTGIFWLTHGIPKIMDPNAAGPKGWIMGMVSQEAAQGSGPYNAFLQHVVLPNAGLFSHLVAWGETLTGISLLLGLLTPVGAIVGMFLPLNYFLMKGSYAHITSLGGSDAAAFALSFINLVLPTGRVFGLDGLRKATPPASRAGEP